MFCGCTRQFGNIEERAARVNVRPVGQTQMSDSTTQDILDEEHLRLLRIGWLISAAANLLWALFPLIYVAMGVFFIIAPMGSGKDAPPREIGYLFGGIGLVISLAMAGLTTLKFLAARAIAHRRSKILIFATAGISCLGIPWGTVIGVLTFIVMARPSVARRFGTPPAALSNST